MNSLKPATREELRAETFRKIATIVLQNSTVDWPVKPVYTLNMDGWIELEQVSKFTELSCEALVKRFQRGRLPISRTKIGKTCLYSLADTLAFAALLKKERKLVYFPKA